MGVLFGTSTFTHLFFKKKYKVRVRLGGGSKPNEGYVEALGTNGTWGGVCDDEWHKIGMKNANVVCRMLGYSSAEAWFHGPGSGGSDQKHNFGSNPSGRSYVFDNLKCAGSESSIFDCPNAGGEWKAHCRPDEIAGVRCAT